MLCLLVVDFIGGWSGCLVPSESYFLAKSHKGFGFVQFDTKQSAVAARLASHGSMVDGKKLFVAKFISKGERAAMSGNQEFTNVYVKNLLESVTEDFLHTMFSQCGTVGL
ncbi:hypothetical protein F2Q70_00040850 [Brassica cretica]|uniref:RRM domain-containing protein n=1 Tax=Brassica cretica TaxID=69181 RepID=A0A8S9K431_BRACR|nr:hypothetical protein F2Q70_00040850 [Brassica cretica]